MCKHGIYCCENSTEYMSWTSHEAIASIAQCEFYRKLLFYDQKEHALK